MPQTEPWTTGRLLQWTTDYLRQSGVEGPRLEAEILLAHARNCSRIELYTTYSEVADDELRDTFRELVKRRASGTPVAYLVGRREFYSLSFQVTSDVLIPRPETEFVVIALMDLVKEHYNTDASLSIIDLGTGSGILAVCAAVHLPGARVVAVDVSQPALDVATLNADEHQVAQRIQFVRSDLFEAISSDSRFDFVISNPPYIGTNERDSLDAGVREHEPPGALFAGAEGHETIERLIHDSADFLNPGGWLICELGPNVKSRVVECFAADGRYEQVSILKDLAKLPRVARARRV